MDNDILWGIGLLLMSGISIWFTKKYPTKGRDIWLLDLKGYLAGVGFFIAALMFFWSAFHKH